MHRFRSWTLDPPEYRTQRNRLLPIEGGDGSTLNLDFTTGVLDPRLTFTRLGNATFINSSGYVEWAAANNFTNSTFSGASGTTIPNWSFSQIAGSATVSLSGTALTITCTTATRARVVQNIGTSTGLFVTTQVKVTARSMAFQLNEVLAYSVNGSSSNEYRVNGVPRQDTFTGWNVGDVISLTCIPTNGAAAQAVIGIGASGAQPSGQSITITDVQVEPGTVARTVIPTGTSGSYQAPRFDHDPTTLASRGLLIEGSAVNTISNSNTIYTSPWGGSAGTTATQDTTIPDPSGGTTTCKIVKASPNQYVVRNQPIPTLTVPANSTVHLTISVWLRMDGANQVAASLGIYDTAGASFGTRSGASVSNSAVTISSGSSADAEFSFGTVTGWVRCSISRSFTNSTGSSITFTGLQFYIYPNRLNTNTTTIYAWGAQAETGVGPTSLMPSGASQGTRDVDNCTIGVNAGTETNFSSWWPLNQAAWTIQWTGDFVRNTTTVQFLWLTRTSGGASVIRVFANSTSGQPLNGFAGNTISPASTVNGTPGALIRTALANQEGDQAFYANNGTVSSSGTATLTSIPTTSANMNFNPNSDQFMHIKTLKFWPTRLPNTTLQGLVS